MMGLTLPGLLGLILLALDIWAIWKTLETDETIALKVFWIVVILLLPLWGLIIWFLVGPAFRR